MTTQAQSDAKRASVAGSLQRLRHENLEQNETDRLVELIHRHAAELGVSITDLDTSALELVTLGHGRRRLRELEVHQHELLRAFHALLAAND